MEPTSYQKEIIMGKTLIEMVSEIVLSQANQKLMSPEEIDALIKKTYKSLKSIQSFETRGASAVIEEIEEAPKVQVSKLIATEPAIPEPPVQEKAPTPKPAREKPEKKQAPAASFEDPMDSIQQDKIVCLECGEKFKQISHTHLSRKHNLTPTQYRKKHGLPKGQPLTSLALTERRKKTAAKLRLGERLKKAREEKAAEATESSEA